MAKLTYTGEQLDAAIRKVRGSYADVSGVILKPGEVRKGKIFIDATKQEIVGTMPDTVLDAVVEVNGQELSDTTSAFPITVTPKAVIDTAGYLAAGKVGTALVKYINVEEKEINPSTTVQSLTPTSGKLLSKVTVQAIQTEEKIAAKNGEVTPSYGKFITKVTVNVQPKLQNKTVIPSNKVQEITFDTGYDGLGTVTVKESTGGELPVLHAPTISLSADTLTLTSPQTNGDFSQGFKVYAGGKLLTTTKSTSLNLKTYIKAAGIYTITATCHSTNFKDSPASNGVTYRNNVLDAPVISLSGSVLTINEVKNGKFYDIYSDGKRVATATNGYKVTMSSTATIDETGGTSTMILNPSTSKEIVISPLGGHQGQVWENITAIKTNFTNGYNRAGELEYTMGATAGKMFDGDVVTLTGDFVITRSINETCLTGDAMILMADHTLKRMDEVNVGDTVLAYNPDTLQLVPDTVIYTDKHLKKEFNRYDIWNLSDGTQLKTVHAHRFYNVDRQTFVYMSEWKTGEHFLKSDGSQPELVSHRTVYKTVNHYAIRTHYHNYFADGALTGSRRAATMHLGTTEVK